MMTDDSTNEQQKINFGLLLAFLCFVRPHAHCDCHDRAADYTNSKIQFKSICHLPDIFFMVVPTCTCNFRFKSNISCYAIHICRLHGITMLSEYRILNAECVPFEAFHFFCSLLFLLSIRMKRKNMSIRFEFNCPISSFSRSTGDLVMWKIRISNDESLVQKERAREKKNVTLIDLNWAFFVSFFFFCKKKVPFEFRILFGSDEKWSVTETLTLIEKCWKIPIYSKRFFFLFFIIEFPVGPRNEWCSLIVPSWKSERKEKQNMFIRNPEWMQSMKFFNGNN